MYWTTTSETLVILHELAHMNARARARHRTAAAAFGGPSRDAHELAATRHETFANQLIARLHELGTFPALKVSRRGSSDAQTGADAALLLRDGMARMLRVYDEAIASPVDADTRRMLAGHVAALRTDAVLSSLAKG